VTVVACIAHAGSADWVRLPDALAALQARFGRVPVYPAGTPGEAEVLAFELAGTVEVLVAYGGDGTIHQIANGLTRARDGNAAAADGPVVVVLPGGTGNDLVRGLGLPVDPVEAAAAVADGTPVPLDLLECSGRVAANGINAGFAASATDVLSRRVKTALGPAASATDVLSRRVKTALGPAAYTVGGVIAAVRLPSWPVRVEAGGDVFEGEAITLVIGNGPSYGGGRRLLPAADMADGLLDVTVVPKGSPKVRLVTGMARKRLPGGLPAFRGPSARIQTGMPCRLDGEPAATPSAVTVLPGAWRVLLPAGAPRRPGS